MSARFSVLLKLFIITTTATYNKLPVNAQTLHTSSHVTQNQNHNNGHNGMSSDWQRNLESQISRVAARLDNLELRVGRVQSLVQMRFDNIENGITTTKLRMDLSMDEVGRMEDQLTRKWKNLESKLELMIGNIDAKLESKLTTIQRDNRRHNDYLTSVINNVAISQEKLSDKVSTAFIQVNSSIESLKSHAKNHTQMETLSTTVLVHNSDKVLNILRDFISNYTSTKSSSSHSSNNVNGGGSNHQNAVGVSTEFQNQTLVQYQLLGNKVANMFEDLMRRSTNTETLIKDAVTLANITRKDVHDGFRNVLANAMSSSHNNQNSHHHSSRNHGSSGSGSGGSGSRSSNYGTSSGGGASSSEVMSAVIVEALASVDSMSSALGRKITEFSRSMDERLEIVSMSINGFLESCTRIQDNEPLLEEHIAGLLIRIMDSVDNSTKSASQLWHSVANQILQERENMTRHLNGINPSCTSQEQEHEEETPTPTGESNGGSESRNIGSGGGLISREPGGNEVIMVTGTEDMHNHNLYRPRSHSRHTNSPHHHHRHHHVETSTDFTEDFTNGENEDTDSFEEGQNVEPPASELPPLPPQYRTRNTDGETLTEEDKKSLWESLTFSPST